MGNSINLWNSALRVSCPAVLLYFSLKFLQFYFSCWCFSVANCVHLFVTPWTSARQASLSFTVSRILLKFMSIELVIELVMLPNLCHPLLLPSIFPSSSLFQWVGSLHQVAKVLFFYTYIFSWSWYTLMYFLDLYACGI